MVSITLTGNKIMEKNISYREIRYKEKRRKILETAARLFANRGYENVTLEEIAAKLKLTRPGLYYYIKSKEQIYFEIQMQALEQGLKAVEEVMAQSTDPVERLRHAIIKHVDIITKEHIVGTFRQKEMQLPPEMMKEVLERRNYLENQFLKLVEDGVESGAYKVRHAKLAVKMILGTLNTIPMWYSPQGELTSDEIGESLAEFILKGFGCDSKKPKSVPESTHSTDHKDEYFS